MTEVPSQRPTSNMLQIDDHVVEEIDNLIATINSEDSPISGADAFLAMGCYDIMNDYGSSGTLPNMETSHSSIGSPSSVSCTSFAETDELECLDREYNANFLSTTRSWNDDDCRTPIISWARMYRRGMMSGPSPDMMLPTTLSLQISPETACSSDTESLCLLPFKVLQATSSSTMERSLGSNTVDGVKGKEPWTIEKEIALEGFSLIPPPPFL